MPSLAFEKQYGRDENKVICGVDEVGRGPLAGPVMAAAVILPAKLPRTIIKEVRDSKKMTHQQREDLFEPLTQLCHYSIAGSQRAGNPGTEYFVGEYAGDATRRRRTASQNRYGAD